MKQARERKARMQAMDKERSKKIPMSDIEAQHREQGEKRVTRAQMLLDEQLDDVKNMNQMMIYSKVVTIRDKQLEENKQLEREWIEE